MAKAKSCARPSCQPIPRLSHALSPPRGLPLSGSAWNRVVPLLGCLPGCSGMAGRVICIDARHAAAALQAGFRNKNDRNDARGIADLMRVNKYRPVWVKSPEAQRHGRLLTARATLQSHLVALENTIRGLLRQEE